MSKDIIADIGEVIFAPVILGTLYKPSIRKPAEDFSRAASLHVLGKQEVDAILMAWHEDDKRLASEIPELYRKLKKSHASEYLTFAGSDLYLEISWLEITNQNIKNSVIMKDFADYVIAGKGLRNRFSWPEINKFVEFQDGVASPYNRSKIFITLVGHSLKMRPYVKQLRNDIIDANYTCDTETCLINIENFERALETIARDILEFSPSRIKRLKAIIYTDDLADLYEYDVEKNIAEMDRKFKTIFERKPGFITSHLPFKTEM